MFFIKILASFPRVRRLNRALYALSILYGVAIVLEIFLICHPVAAYWDARIRTSCGNEIVSYTSLEVCGLLIDIVSFIFHLPLIQRLQVESSKKISTLLVVSSGALYVHCSQISIVVLIVLVQVTVITGLRIRALHLANSSDLPYARGYLGMLSTLGAHLGVITCCFPANWYLLFTKNGRSALNVFIRSLNITIETQGLLRSIFRTKVSGTVKDPGMLEEGYGPITRPLKCHTADIVLRRDNTTPGEGNSGLVKGNSSPDKHSSRRSKPNSKIRKKRCIDAFVERYCLRSLLDLCTAMVHKIRYRQNSYQKP